MGIFKKVERELTTKMQEAFSSTSDRKNAVHATAAAGAAIVALLPIGADAWALRLSEWTMVMLIASSYGEKLTKSAAKGLFLSSFAQLAGETAAISALEAAEVAKTATLGTGIGPAAAYAIKTTVAVGLIESVGHMVIAYYEKPGGLGSKACKVAEGIGFAADVARVTSALTDKKTLLAEESISESGGSGNPISFTGEGSSYGHSESYWAKKAAEAEAKGSKSSYDYAMKRLKEAIEDRLKNGK